MGWRYIFKNLQPKVISTSLPGRGMELVWKDKYNERALTFYFT